MLVLSLCVPKPEQPLRGCVFEFLLPLGMNFMGMLGLAWQIVVVDTGTAACNMKYGVCITSSWVSSTMQCYTIVSASIYQLVVVQLEWPFSSSSTCHSQSKRQIANEKTLRVHTHTTFNQNLLELGNHLLSLSLDTGHLHYIV